MDGSEKKPDAEIESECNSTHKTKEAEIDDSESKTEPKKCIDAELRVSAEPDFLCIAQFIGTFGLLLGIPPMSLDTLEDGLQSNNMPNIDAYFAACSNAVEHLLISLLKRCGILSNVEKLMETLRQYFELRDETLHALINCQSFHQLETSSKLKILKFVCLSQFDENTKFKTEFNSQFSPDDLRWQPLGRDMDSCQYWFISDSDKNHRLYCWKYPYSTDQWSLLSSSYNELICVKDKLQPLEDEEKLKESKLWEVFKEQALSSAVQTEEKPVRKPRKKKKETAENSDVRMSEQDEDVEFRVNLSPFASRKSLRNVDRKVYTEPNYDNETSEEEEEEQREVDDKYKKAITIAKSRKRSKKFLSITETNAHHDKVRMDLLKQQLNRRYIENNIKNCQMKKNSVGTPSKVPKIEVPESPITTIKSEEDEMKTPVVVETPNSTPNSSIDHNVKVETIDATPSAVAAMKNKSHETYTLSPILVKTKPKDPFAFSDSSSRQSSDSNASTCGKEESLTGKNGGLSHTPMRNTASWTPGFKPYTRYHNPVTRQFIETLKSVPSLSTVKKPEEAEDKCWKCEGEDDVDKMLFCDGCDLATYHMACLQPPIEEVPEDDWYCPICEQVLLYLNIRDKVTKLKIHQQPQPKKRAYKRNNAVARSPYSSPRHVRPMYSSPSMMRRPQFPPTTTIQHHPMSHTAMRLVTPITRPPTRVQYVIPNRAAARPKIGQISRLAETARLVFDPSKDDSMHMSPLERERHMRLSRMRDESSDDTDSEVVRPQDESSSDDSADHSKFSYRPVRPLYGQQPPGIRQPLSSQTRISNHPAEYFLNNPTKPAAEQREKKIMGYNPLNYLRHPPNSRSPMKTTPAGASDMKRTDQVRKANETPAYDTATAIMEGRPLPNGDDDSRSGNVVTPTSELSDSQRQALAAWEDMERDRKRDNFDFDE